jgi:hypothetical protein
MNSKKVLVVVGLVLVVFAGVWKFGISSRWEQRYPADWSWNLETIGGSWYAASPEDPLPSTDMRDDPLTISSRDIHVESKGDNVEIQDKYVAYDATTNVETWNFTYRADLDPQSGAYADADDEYYFFPRNLDKDTTYKIRNSSYPTLSFKFEEEEEIEGLTTYRFGYHGPYPNTAAYEGLVTLEEGQEIRCANLDLQFWIEPLTGEVVNYYEGCTGDEVFDTATNEHVSWVGRWWGEPKSEDVVQRVAEIHDQRRIILWTTRYIPLGLLLVGLASIVAGFMRKSMPAANA